MDGCNKKYDILLGALGFDNVRRLAHLGAGALELISDFCLSPEERARLDFLTEIANCLLSYENHGIYLWFMRRRRVLGNESPAVIFLGDWRPEDPGPQKVLALAKAIAGPMNAT